MNKIHLSDGEWNIMRILWEKAPKTITELTAMLDQKTGWSKHTIITMLRRMEEKGTVRYEETGRAKQFYPTVEKDAVSMDETETFLEKVYDGSLGLMLQTMVSGKNFSKKEIEDLYSILDQAEKGVQMK